MESIWYYRNERVKEGSFTEEEFVTLIQKGIIGAEDEIWMLQMKNWKKLKETIYSHYLPEPVISNKEV